MPDLHTYIMMILREKKLAQIFEVVFFAGRSQMCDEQDCSLHTVDDGRLFVNYCLSYLQ